MRLQDGDNACMSIHNITLNITENTNFFENSSLI